MWDKVLKAFRQTLDKAEATYLTKAKSAYAVTALAIVCNDAVVAPHIIAIMG